MMRVVYNLRGRKTGISGQQRPLIVHDTVNCLLRWYIGVNKKLIVLINTSQIVKYLIKVSSCSTSTVQLLPYNNHIWYTII